MLLGSTNLLLARSDAEPLPSLRPMALVSCSDTAPGAVGELLPAHEESLLAPRLQGALPAETSVTHTDHKSLQALRLAGDRARLRSIASGNPAAAERLMHMVKAVFEGAQVRVTECGGLCSYYAEQGGLMVG